MNNYTENDTFSFGEEESMFSPNYNEIVDNSNSQNEELFNNEVSNDVIGDSVQNLENQNDQSKGNIDVFSAPVNPFVTSESNQILTDLKEDIKNIEGVAPMQVSEYDSNQEINVSENIFDEQPQIQKNSVLESNLNENNIPYEAENENAKSQIEEAQNVNENNIMFESTNSNIDSQIDSVLSSKLDVSESNSGENNIPFETENENIEIQTDENVNTSTSNMFEMPQTLDNTNIFNSGQSTIGSDVQLTNEPVSLGIANLNESFDSTNALQNNLIDNLETNLESNENNLTVDVAFENNVQESTDNVPEELPSLQPETISMSDENLDNLTEFKEEEDVKKTDIKSLFDRVGINVKEASDIFKRNTEMKEKIDSRFEELKKLQSEVSKVKKAQYDEINAYKEEVLGRLTSKKDEIELRLNKLKDFQKSLEKEKAEFEQYRKSQKEEIERIQKEVQDAYDNRREELKRIEDILRKQKDSLDEERNQLNLDKIQYESDKNELANNLLKFNEIVDSFTNGIEKIEKE